MKKFGFVIVVVVAVAATWLSARWYYAKKAAAKASEGGERSVLYYQSAMHPWVKSDKPGRCTICGMELTPVYEGETGFDRLGGGDIVPLSDSAIRALNVRTAEVGQQSLRKRLPVAGTIDDDATRHRVLSAYIPGRVEKLYVNYVGAEVRQGQPLAEFYSPALLQAEREYLAVSGDLRETAALRLRQMGLSLEQIAGLPKKEAGSLTSQILAPMDGAVVSQNVYEGQYVQEGERLFEIADFSTMWFQFQAYEQDLPWLKPGLKVDVTTPAHPGRIFSGTIIFIDPNLDAATRSAKVRVELDNPLVDGRRLLLHRMYADGVVHLDEVEVTAVPRSAVIETGPEAVVYVDRGGGAYERRSVLLGRRGEQSVEVLAGVTNGEQVVVNGNLLIDSQAEMNRSLGGAVAPHAHQHTSASEQGTDSEAGKSGIPKLPALTDEQRVALTAFLGLIDSLTASLAADDLKKFNEHAAKTHSVLPALDGAFEHDSPWQYLLKSIRSSGHLADATDLSQARRIFHPLSVAAVGLVKVLRKEDPEFASVKVYRCPMTESSFEGAPRQAEWIQMKPPLRNPYFGAEMLECGAEVKP